MMPRSKDFTVSERAEIGKAGGVLREQAEKHMTGGVVAQWKILTRVHLPATSPTRLL